MRQLEDKIAIVTGAGGGIGSDARYVTGHNLVVDGGTVSHVPGFAQVVEMFGAH